MAETKSDRSTKERLPLIRRRHSLQAPTAYGTAHDSWSKSQGSRFGSRLSLGSKLVLPLGLSRNRRESWSQTGSPLSETYLHNRDTEGLQPNQSPLKVEYDPKQTASWPSTGHERSLTLDSGNNALMDSQERNSVSTPRIFEAEVRNFIEMQRSITILRLHMQEKRKTVRFLQDGVADADRRLMDALRVGWTTGTLEDGDKLEALYNRCVLARDEAGPALDDYEMLELRLSSEEFKLVQSLESPHPLGFVTAQHESENSSGSAFSYSSSYDEDESIDAKNVSQLHGVNLGESLPVGQKPQATSPTQRTETVDSLEVEVLPVRERQNAALTSEGEVRRSKLDESDMIPIDISAPDLHVEKAWNPLNHGTERLDVSENDLPADDIDLNVSGNTEGLFQGSKLLLRSSVIDHADASIFKARIFRPESSKYLRKFNNVHNRTERWLLHQLRSSVREISQLRDEIMHRYTKYIPISERWPDLALKLWETDPPSYDETSPLRTLQKSISSREDNYAGPGQRRASPVPVMPSTILYREGPNISSDGRNLTASSNEVVSQSIPSSDGSFVRIHSMNFRRGTGHGQDSLPLPPGATKDI